MADYLEKWQIYLVRNDLLTEISKKASEFVASSISGCTATVPSRVGIAAGVSTVPFTNSAHKSPLAPAEVDPIYLDHKMIKRNKTLNVNSR